MAFRQKLGTYSLVYKILAGGFCCFTIFNVYNGSEKFYDKIVMPASRMFGVRFAHNLVSFANKYRLLPKSHYEDPETLHSSFLNLNFSNPLGVASGYDKKGEAIMGLMDVGFSFVEVGSMKPQLEMLSDVKDLNENTTIQRQRFSFDNECHERILQRIADLRQSKNFKGIIGVNLTYNLTTEDPINDFMMGVKKFGYVADYLVINLARSAIPKNKAKLERLIGKVNTVRNALVVKTKPLLLLKLSPDLTAPERQSIAIVLSSRSCQIDGLIIPCQSPDAVSNDRTNFIIEGLANFDTSNESILDMYKLTEGKVPIIVDGGVFTGRDAYEKIRAGASLIQIYSPFIYHGPPRVTRIKRDLDKLLKEDGFRNVSEAVGADTRTKEKHYYFPFY